MRHHFRLFFLRHPSHRMPHLPLQALPPHLPGRRLLLTHLPMIHCYNPLRPTDQSVNQLINDQSIICQATQYDQPSPSPPPPSPPPETLTNWAEKSLILRSDWQLAERSGLRGAVAMSDIEPGSMLACVPRSACLVVHDKDACPLPLDYIKPVIVPRPGP